MNNKYLLIAMVASSFSGMNLIANPEGTIETPNIPTKTFKGITDKLVKKHCRENNTPLCEELSKLMAATDKINLEEIDTLLHKITEEMKAKGILIENRLEKLVDNAKDFAVTIEQTLNEEVEKISEKLTE